jgi:hypothetical protein
VNAVFGACDDGLIADGTIIGRHDPEHRDLHLRSEQGVEAVVILDGKVATRCCRSCSPITARAR